MSGVLRIGARRALNSGIFSRTSVSSMSAVNLHHVLPEQKRGFSDRAAQGIATLGELRELGLGAFYTPVGLIQNLFELVSATAGIPWVASIMVTTVLIRSAIMPFTIKSTRSGRIMMNIREELDFHSQRMRQLHASGDTAGMQRVKQNLNEIYKENKTHPFSPIMPLIVQMPIFISSFIALRKLCMEGNIESLAHGGMLWFPDLSAADPTYALPLMSSAAMILSLELAMDKTMPMNKTMINIFRGFGVLSILFTYDLPAGIFMYWIPSSVFTVFQAKLVQSEFGMKLFGIPKLTERARKYIEANQSQGFLKNFSAAKKQAADAAAQQEKARAEKLNQEVMSRLDLKDITKSESTQPKSPKSHRKKRRRRR